LFASLIQCNSYPLNLNCLLIYATDLMNWYYYHIIVYAKNFGTQELI